MKELPKIGDKVWVMFRQIPKEVKVIQKINIPIFNSLFVIEDENGDKFGCHKSDMYYTKEDLEEHSKKANEGEE